MAKLEIQGRPWFGNWLLVVTMAAAASLAMTDARGQDQVRDTLERAKVSQPGLRSSIDRRTGLPSRLRNIEVIGDPTLSLGATRSAGGQPSEDSVKRAVEAFFARSSLRSAFPQGNARANRVVESVRPDPGIPGRSVATVRQEVDGIPVFGSSAKVTVNRSLAVTGLTASMSRVDITDTSATIDEATATRNARTRLAGLLSNSTRRQFGTGAPRGAFDVANTPATAQKVIFDPKLVNKRGGSTQTRVAWLVSIDTYRMFIDAKSGDLLYFYQDHRSLTVRQVFDLGGKREFPGISVLDEKTGTHGGQASADAVAAYANSGIVRDFFFAMFGRRSFDDTQNSQAKTGPIVSYVRLGNVQNAYWCGQAGQGCPAPHVSVYGPGYASALDVMGHEFTHGVIMHEAKLIYADESGAVDESLADILGSLIEFHARGAGGNWALGEELPGLSISSPLRSLKDPTLRGEGGVSLFQAGRAFPSRNEPWAAGSLLERGAQG